MSAWLGGRGASIFGLTLCADGFDAHPAHLPQTAVHRAASITRATMLFRQQLKLGQIKPEGSKDAPFCMDTFR